MTLDAGTFQEIKLHPKTGIVGVGLSRETPFTPAARLRVEQPDKAKASAVYRPTGDFSREREDYVVPLKKEVTWIELKPQR